MTTSGGRNVPWVLACVVACLLVVGGALMWRADRAVNKVALSHSAKPATYTPAQAAQFRPKRTYVGTFEPWVQASVGPQLVSAYVATVLVRPGAAVRRGDILATLDCRNASAATQAVSMQARALDARQQALSHESARTQGMLHGGFVSPNEAERISAQSAAESAELEATRAKLMSSNLEVSDCVLRAPFDGEVANRFVDPGAFVHPGTPIVMVVDRKIVRLVADAPESDFDAINPNTIVSIHAYATRSDFAGIIVRRAPSAEPSTRTVRFEIDLADPRREIPVYTTAEVHIDVGTPQRATAVPLYAAAVRGEQATLFVVENNHVVSKTVHVIGESGGMLFVDPSLSATANVITEGRALLQEGDAIAGKLAAPPVLAQAYRLVP